MGRGRVWERLSETHSVIGGHSHWLPIFSVVGLCEVSTQQVPERQTEIARVRESERARESERERKRARQSERERDRVRVRERRRH